MSDQDERPGGFRTPELISRETGTLLPEQELYLYLIRAAEVAGGPISDLFQSHGLSRKQYGVLRSIRRKGSAGATVNDVRRQMTDLRADVTRLIDRLERDGLVERRHDSADRRVVRVFLAEAGEKVLRDIDEPLLEIHRKQFGIFTAEEIAVLAALLKRMR